MKRKQNRKLKVIEIQQQVMQRRLKTLISLSGVLLLMVVGLVVSVLLHVLF